MRLLLFSLAMVMSFPCASYSEPASQIEAPYGMVGFEDLHVKDVIIGILPNEREETQDLIIDVKVACDLIKGCSKGSNAISEELAEMTEQMAREGKYFFIDVLGFDILQEIFAKYPAISEATIKIQKPAALPDTISGGMVMISSTREEMSQKEKIIGEIGFHGLLVTDTRVNGFVFVDLLATIDLIAVNEANELDATVSYVKMAEIFEEQFSKYQEMDDQNFAILFSKDLISRYPKIEKVAIRLKRMEENKSDAVTELVILNKGENE